MLTYSYVISLRLKKKKHSYIIFFLQNHTNPYGEKKRKITLPTNKKFKKKKTSYSNH